MLTIDGSLGEGGGQILRTALSLALVTGTSFRLVRLRARRARPGLQRQHLVAVQAAAAVGQAEVRGATLGSLELTFVPAGVRAGDYTFDIGSAGSTTLVLQTILPPLLRADRPSTLRLSGGTHNPLAPPADFIQQTFVPLINRLGPRVAVTLLRPGFYPAGGGQLHVTVVPARLVPFDLPARGPVRRVRATAWLARLPRHIADRELRTVAARLGLPDEALAVREAADAAGPGNAVCIEVMAAHVTELFTAFGRRGVPAEQVAEEAAALAERYLAADVPAGEFLADQLLLPLAMAGGGSFRTLALSPHAQTNRAVIQQFLAGPIEVSAEPGGTCTVRFAKATETAHVQNG